MFNYPSLKENGTNNVIPAELVNALITINNTMISCSGKFDILSWKTVILRFTDGEAKKHRSMWRNCLPSLLFLANKPLISTSEDHTPCSFSGPTQWRLGAAGAGQRDSVQASVCGGLAMLGC